MGSSPLGTSPHRRGILTPRRKYTETSNIQHRTPNVEVKTVSSGGTTIGFVAQASAPAGSGSVSLRVLSRGGTPARTRSRDGRVTRLAHCRPYQEDSGFGRHPVQGQIAAHPTGAAGCWW